MRRTMSSWSASFTMAGAVRVLLSRVSNTSAMLRAGRVPAPEKMTSSISLPRICFDEVRLAAAVGADDAGHAGFDGEFRRVDEGLEAGEPEFVELHHLHHAGWLL